jgi:hypothetical protein
MTSKAFSAEQSAREEHPLVDLQVSGDRLPWSTARRRRKSGKTWFRMLLNRAG